MGQKKHSRIQGFTYQFQLTQLCNVSMSDEVADSDDDWDVEDVEADDGHSVEALGVLRSEHGDVEKDVDVVGQELDS